MTIGQASGSKVYVKPTVPKLTETEVCKGAGGDRNHRKRQVGEDGWCHTCHYARKRRRRTQGRLSAVLRGYGLTEADLKALRDAQRRGYRDGKVHCRCGRVIGVTKEPAVDHWHGCPWCAGKGCRRCVRGLLCSPCNVFIGYIGDRPEALIELAIHIVTMPAQDVLTALDRAATMDTSA